MKTSNTSIVDIANSLRLDIQLLCALTQKAKENMDAKDIRISELEAEITKLRTNIVLSAEEIMQTLGKALEYPWYKDDQKNFPGSTEDDGVCVGDHSAESIAVEAADKIDTLQFHCDLSAAAYVKCRSLYYADTDDWYFFGEYDTRIVGYLLLREIIELTDETMKHFRWKREIK